MEWDGTAAARRRAPSRRSRERGTPPGRRSARRLGLAALLASLVALAGTLASGGRVAAHARFLRSDPAPNQVLAQAPARVTIEFVENLDPSRSDIVVYDNLGHTVSRGPARVDFANPKKMTVDMRGDDSEVYVVYWHNLSSEDGHPDAGSFTFGIGAPPGGSGGSAPSSAAAAGGSSVAPGWLALLAGLAGVAIGAAGGIFLSRRVRHVH